VKGRVITTAVAAKVGVALEEAMVASEDVVVVVGATVVTAAAEEVMVKTKELVVGLNSRGLQKGSI
jgi:hypothetical protein